MSLNIYGGRVKRQNTLTLTSVICLRAIALLVGFVVLNQPLVSAKVVSQRTIKKLETNDDTEKKLIKKVTRFIKKTIKNATGTPYFVSCRYTIKNNEPVAASTEIRYAEYRKPSESTLVEYKATDGTHDRVVDFVFKPSSPKTLAVVERDPVKITRRLAAKKIAIDL